MFLALIAAPVAYADGISPATLAVVFNRQDALSVQIAEYYVERRRIPRENLIEVSFPTRQARLSREEFARIRRQVEYATPPRVQAYALAWTLPFRVDCMSITSAFALGFDETYCSRVQCGRTRYSPYYRSSSRAPFNDFHVRPAMTLAAETFEQAKALIDRGIESDGTRPEGTAWLVSTSDKNRNVRAPGFSRIAQQYQGRFRVEISKADAIAFRNDVMFYFTGVAQVQNLATNRFLPGSIGDHLTSTGGVLARGNSQMSVLRWLEAGATGSYGAVVEPCNLVQKFPDPAVVMNHYLAGETLIEAYWKSVAMPGEGIFVGEPLARPFGQATRE